MKCVYCNTPLAAIEYCPGCGADVSLQKRIVRISNLLYNRGLEKASVRDLSGAINCLKQSLKFNKENVDARNLLGLCYFETGEVVSALCEWVISKNLMPENNLADYYITQLQNNKNRLDIINQTIKKYNQSIEYCRQGNEDMAIIQLKKVVNQNPKLVKAHQLLALLYMKNQDYEKARRLLKKAANVDNTNTTTLRYLTEIEEITGKSTAFGTRKKRLEGEEEEGMGGTLRYVSGNETIIQPTTFRDSSTVATFINIALGILLGGAIVWFLVVPSTKQSVKDSANQQVTDANMKLASESARLQDLQDQIDDYEEKANLANHERDSALEKAESFQELLAVANLYVTEDQIAAADAVAKLNGDDFDGNASALYDNLKLKVSSALFDQYYTAGTVAYMAGDYVTAAQQLQMAVDSDPQRTHINWGEALYYLGFAYYNQGDITNADATFNKVISDYPARAYEVQPYISSNSNGSSAGTGSQGEAATQGGQNGVVVYEDPYGGLGYDPSLVAWTDPNTGLNYDMYGNLLG